MKESVDQYRSELPPQCVDCPLFDSGSKLARAAEGTGNLMRAAGYPAPAEPPLGFYGPFPDLRPGAAEGRSREAQRALTALGELASAAEACTGSRAGAGLDYGWVARMAGLLSGRRTCRNPLVRQVMQNYPER